MEAGGGRPPWVRGGGARGGRRPWGWGGGGGGGGRLPWVRGRGARGAHAGLVLGGGAHGRGHLGRGVAPNHGGGHGERIWVRRVPGGNPANQAADDRLQPVVGEARGVDDFVGFGGQQRGRGDRGRYQQQGRRPRVEQVWVERPRVAVVDLPGADRNVGVVEVDPGVVEVDQLDPGVFENNLIHPDDAPHLMVDNVGMEFGVPELEEEEADLAVLEDARVEHVIIQRQDQRYERILPVALQQPPELGDPGEGGVDAWVHRAQAQGRGDDPLRPNPNRNSAKTEKELDQDLRTYLLTRPGVNPLDCVIYDLPVHFPHQGVKVDNWVVEFIGKMNCIARNRRFYVYELYRKRAASKEALLAMQKFKKELKDLDLLKEKIEAEGAIAPKVPAILRSDPQLLQVSKYSKHAQVTGGSKKR